MKKILLSILCSTFLFISFYTQADTKTDNTKTDTKEPSIPAMDSPSSSYEKTGFFHFSLGGEVSPQDDFEYHTTIITIKFGGIISQQNSFNAGIKFTTHKIEHSFLVFQYSYDFIDGTKWVPGVDATLLLGFKRYDTDEDTYEYKYKLSAGFELGPYLKTFISRSHALLLRAGATLDTSTEGSLDLTESRIYLNLGFQWYF